MNAYDVKRDIYNGEIKNIILDTDTYNEIDDQYALAYAMLAGSKVRLLSVNAAPFLNSRSVSPGDGMEKSYNEIKNIMKLTDKNSNIPVFRGSEEFLSEKTVPVESPAADNIIKTVMERDELTYIVAIGAITNVASAVIKCPEIAGKAVVVWLGGHALHWNHSREFNMVQDVKAAQVIFDSGIPLVQIPCMGVCSMLHTSVPELEYHLGGSNELCDYLVKITAEYNHEKSPVWSKVIWDISAVAAVANPRAMDIAVIPRPIITDNSLYAFDSTRAPMLYVRYMDRDMIFGEVFEILKTGVDR